MEKSTVLSSLRGATAVASRWSVRVGESSEAAAAREALEETGLAVTQLRQWCVFSEPSRDPRRHTAALVFVARARGTPKASDDAKGDKPLAVNSTRFF